MTDDGSGFLATDSGWWVGLILDQEVQVKSWLGGLAGRPHEETPLDVTFEGDLPSVHTERGEGSTGRKTQANKWLESMTWRQVGNIFIAVYSLCQLSSQVYLSKISLFPVYVQLFPAQRLRPAGVSRFVHLISEMTRRYAGIYLANLQWFGHFAVWADAFI